VSQGAIGSNVRSSTVGAKRLSSASRHAVRHGDVRPTWASAPPPEAAVAPIDIRCAKLGIRECSDAWFASGPVGSFHSWMVTHRSVQPGPARRPAAPRTAAAHGAPSGRSLQPPRERRFCKTKVATPSGTCPPKALRCTIQSYPSQTYNLTDTFPASTSISTI
jgi:hypothetical protein